MFERKISTGLIKWTSVIIGLFFAQGAFAQTADFILSPASGAYEVGKSFSVKIQTNSTEQVNSADGVVSFDKNLLKVKSISKEGSAFNLWVPSDPTYSNTGGTITFGGGSILPLKSGKNTILTVIFTAQKAGDAEVIFKSGKILSGPGIDITGEMTGAVFTIEDTQTVAPDPKPNPKPKPVTIPVPSAPELDSTGFEDSEKWYATTTVTFTWQLTYDVVEVRLLLDDQPDSTPTVSRGLVTQKTLTELEEGESYFHIMFKNAAGWGDSTHRKIRVDMTAPEEFSVTASQDDVSSQDVTLVFKTTDKLSGVDYYDIALDGTFQERVTKEDIIDGSYTFYVADSGEHVFLVTAFDAAGNSTDTEAVFAVEEVLVNKKEKRVEEEPVEDGGMDWGYWIILVFVAVTAFLVGSIVYERRAIRTEKEYIKKEADEAREKLEGIFAVLRDEVEEQVIALATKPNMTESERAILEKLKEALEISEELLDKEIEDVRKLL